MKINLLQISFIISLLGIFTLLIISNTLQPPITKISQITTKQLNQNIKIQGNVISSKIFQDSNFQLINLQDKTGNITITLNNPVNITKNQSLIITGKVIQYKEKLEVQADEIVLND